MEDNRRLFLIVLDSVGIGEAPDAAQFGDEGSNTVRAAVEAGADRSHPFLSSIIAGLLEIV